jgi:hypothetical protein
MCRACTFLTRETGKGESELALCAGCYAAFCVEGKNGDEFGVSHGLMKEEDFVSRHGEHSDYYLASLAKRATLQGVDPYQYASHLASMNID